MLEHAVRAFIDRPDVSAVVVVRDPSGPLPLSEALAQHPGLLRCAGGAVRAESVQAGLERLAGMAQPPEMIAIHDAARPAVSAALIDRVFAVALEQGACVPGVALTDTVKQVRDAQVERTLPRSSLVAVQTPQAMRRAWLTEAYARCAIALGEITDDAQLLELAGFPVGVVEGEASNLKLTRSGDLPLLARALASGG